MGYASNWMGDTLTQESKDLKKIVWTPDASTNLASLSCLHHRTWIQLLIRKNTLQRCIFMYEQTNKKLIHSSLTWPHPQSTTNMSYCDQGHISMRIKLWGSGGRQASPCSRPRPRQQLFYLRVHLVVVSLRAQYTKWECKLRAILYPAVKLGGRRCGHRLLDHTHGIHWWRVDGGMSA